MIKTEFSFNAIIYAIVIAYILYINIAAYMNKTTGFLNFLTRLFQNVIFRTIFLLVIGFFALDLYPYGGFILAVLLTIAFLNTNMLIYKRDVGETYQNAMDDDDIDESFLNLDSDEYAQLDDDSYDDFMGYESYANQDDEYDQALEDVYNATQENFKSEKKAKKTRQNCGPYAPLQRLPFNPQGYRPDESVLSSGAPDALPNDSLANGEYTTSGVAYEFNMA